MEQKLTKSELTENHIEALRAMLGKVDASTALAQRLRKRIADLQRDMAELKAITGLYDRMPDEQHGTIGLSPAVLDKSIRAFADDLEAERAAFEAECEKK
jgi:hypothetical protein